MFPAKSSININQKGYPKVPENPGFEILLETLPQSNCEICQKNVKSENLNVIRELVCQIRPKSIGKKKDPNLIVKFSETLI